VRLLIVDNYDSYTFNLFQMFAALAPVAPTVVRNDSYSWAELRRAAHDAIVVSPGPGHPANPGDFGVCDDIIRNAQVPVLGVCLGHQGIATAYGGHVAEAAEPMHGRVSWIAHNDDSLFAGLPPRFEATRYHSLCVHDPLPADLVPIAWDDDGVVMALRARDRPLWGVQFHPESIGTPSGAAIASNFLRASAKRRPAASSLVATHTLKSVVPRRNARVARSAAPEVMVRRVPSLPDAARVFEDLFAAKSSAFWLDSSMSDDPRLARFSFLGTVDGPCGQIVTYDVASNVTTAHWPATGKTLRHALSIFDYIDSQLAEFRASAEVPFDLQGGFVGYLSYEMKGVCGGAVHHASRGPDAQFLFADRIVVLDHAEEATYLVSLQPADCSNAAVAWHDTAERVVHGARHEPRAELARLEDVRTDARVRFTLQRGRDDYEADIRRCQDFIRRGESYEICLTNQLHTQHRPDPYLTYLALRRLNPAPYAAFLRFGATCVLSSSPERFLKITRDGTVEAKPIKGTRRRAADVAEDTALSDGLRASVKDRAENLMIVDLLRNDMGLVCKSGSVTVPTLMAVESYATVHQLVSTIRGRLREGITPGDCVRACFPGGSMTGAPKKRTMEIIDTLEPGPRGVYSGTVGFFSVNATTDLSIVIRTLVFDQWGVSVGAGGAITALSDPREEFDELILKATAPLEALAYAATGRRDGYDIEGL
jgi:para-aminobenzoate synthetase